jgi:hypothetical protein
MKALESFGEREARGLIGLAVVDDQGERIGSFAGTWVDPSTHCVEFMGLRSSWLFRSTHLIPARNVQVEQGQAVVRVEFPAEFLKRAPRYNPKAELSDVEKQGINAYYGHFVPLRRVSAGFLQSGRVRNRCHARSERRRRIGANNQRSEAAGKGI